ncbi:hypothetical protein CSAL01_08179 [Colletotrichum salicis]|uniref:Uncharacterized protein n=1 Tax=Colletotrichum salicis TaxID=1209931 RepID=A0A135U5T4_9PEZI|nr:hypothetical protein CSAL01_08179 [Colletotrichum salicis]
MPTLTLPGGMAEKKSGYKADSRPTFSSAPSRRSGGTAESRAGSPCTCVEICCLHPDSDPRKHAYLKMRYKIRPTAARASENVLLCRWTFDFSGAVRNIRPKCDFSGYPSLEEGTYSMQQSRHIPSQVSNPPHRKSLSPSLPTLSRREIPPETQATHVELFERFLNPEFWGSLAHPRCTQSRWSVEPIFIPTREAEDSIRGSSNQGNASGPLFSAGTGYGTLFFGQQRLVAAGYMTGMPRSLCCSLELQSHTWRDAASVMNNR